MKHVIIPIIIALSITSGTHATSESATWQEPMLDNCLAMDNVSSIGTTWTPSLDHDRGGSSSIEWFSSEGSFGVKGTIKPVPGSMGPGTAGMILPLGPEGAEFDINDFDGIRISIKRSGAPLLLRIHSSEIQNGDYFAVVIPESNDFEIHSFSFSEFGQVMSLPRPWSGKQVTAVELAAYGWSTEEFSWEIDELAFFQEKPKDEQKPED